MFSRKFEAINKRNRAKMHPFLTRFLSDSRFQGARALITIGTTK
jgi:hypothetical protein